MRRPIRHANAKYRTVDQMVEATNLCRGTVVRLAKEARAYLTIGRAVRIDSDRFFEHVEKEYAG